MKAIVLMLLSVGVLACNETQTNPHTNMETFYLRVQRECPKVCTEDKGVWSGLLRAYPDIIKCICEEKHD